MFLHSALAYSGFAAAVVLLVAAAQSRGLAAIAVIGAGLEVAIQLGQVHLAVAHVPLGLVLGVAVAVPALVIWFRSSTKAAVTAASVTAFIGLVKIVAYALPKL